MPAGFTRSQVEAIAALANLELDTDEIDRYARQLADILAYANQLQQIDTAGVTPTASVTHHEATRPDHLRSSIDRSDALANAPDAAVDVGFFKVPRVIG